MVSELAPQELMENTPATRRIVVAAVVVWATVLLVIGVHAFLYPRTHSIFPFYSFGSHAFWEGHDLYHGSGLDDEFQNGPLFAVAVSPLAYLPERWGNMLWKLLNAGIFLAALALWLRCALPERLHSREVAIVFLLALGDSLQCVYDGNSNLFVIAAILLALAAVVRDKTVSAGAWLASATLAKAFPITIAALLTVVCGASITWPFAAALAVGLALPVAIRPSAGLSQSRAWFDVLASRTNQRQIRHLSIEQLFRIYGHPIPITWSNMLAAAAGLVAMGLCLSYARRSSRREALTFTLAAFSAWILLFLPSLEAATLAVAAPSIALALVDASRRRLYGWVTMLAVTWWLLGPALTDIMGKHARLFFQGHGAVPVGGLLFACYLVSLWRRPSEASAESAPELARMPSSSHT
jgi:hypothetical protein